MIDKDFGRYHSLGISALRVDSWNFPDQSCIPTEAKALPPAKRPNHHAGEYTPRMLQSHVVSHALAKICFLQNTMATTHRLIVLPAPAVWCKISYPGSGVSNRSSVHHERLMETRQSYGITPSHFSTAISSVLHANFWLQLSTIGDKIMAMSRTTSLLFSSGKDFVKLRLYQISYIFIHTVL
jgi:hypothetical protein